VEESPAPQGVVEDIDDRASVVEAIGSRASVRGNRRTRRKRGGSRRRPPPTGGGRRERRPASGGIGNGGQREGVPADRDGKQLSGAFPLQGESRKRRSRICGLGRAQSVEEAVGRTQATVKAIGRGLIPPAGGTGHSALPNAPFLWGGRPPPAGGGGVREVASVRRPSERRSGKKEMRG
jgi:hypothetical protein